MSVNVRHDVITSIKQNIQDGVVYLIISVLSFPFVSLDASPLWRIRSPSLSSRDHHPFSSIFFFFFLFLYRFSVPMLMSNHRREAKKTRLFFLLLIWLYSIYKEQKEKNRREKKMSIKTSVC